MKKPKTTEEVSSQNTEKAFMQTQMPMTRSSSGGKKACEP
jgi:hypothetical protein